MRSLSLRFAQLSLQKRILIGIRGPSRSLLCTKKHFAMGISDETIQYRTTSRLRISSSVSSFISAWYSLSIYQVEEPKHAQFTGVIVGMEHILPRSKRRSFIRELEYI